MASAVTYASENVYQASTAPTNPNSNLKSEDFINLLITQLQNQDPLEPMKNEQILTQVTQIGTLQSQTELSSSIKEMVLQNQVSAASGMIGKLVAGVDDQGSVMAGVVTSVKVVDKNVVLQLDNGQEIELARVTGVTEAPVGSETSSSESETSDTSSQATE